MKVRLKQALQTGQTGKDTYRAMSRVQIRMNSNDSKREQEQLLYKDGHNSGIKIGTAKLSAEGE